MHRRHTSRSTRTPSAPTETGVSTKTAVAPATQDHNTGVISVEEIRLRAFLKWEVAGKPTGDGIPFWLVAEQELLQGK
jgi:hypothetical protein